MMVTLAYALQNKDDDNYDHYDYVNRKCAAIIIQEIFQKLS